MSPHAVPTSPIIDSDYDNVNLYKDFDVSSQGFLPAAAPLELLPDERYASWEFLAHNIPQLLREGTLRIEVDSLDVLNTDSLLSEAEWRGAYVILTFLAQAYIWGGIKPAEVIPPPISIPLLSVAKKLDLPPVLTYAASNLWNFRCQGSSDFADLDKLQSIHTLTGTEDESWFYMISVAIEAKAGAAVPTMIQALSAAVNRDYEVVVESLESLSESIHQAGKILERMYERCDPHIFFNQIRPFLAGSKNMEAAGLPNGVYFDEGAGKGRWAQLRGGSNGQSSLIQFFDIVLGVEHRDEGNSMPNGGGSFHEEVRGYMPEPHRRLLQHVKSKSSIRDFVMLPISTPEHLQLQSAFSSAVRALTEFRDKHIQIVTRYIILPSKQKRSTTAETQNLASASFGMDKQGEQRLTGTGGTTLIPFLKQSRGETWAARLPE